jgi:hypothetical protein
MIIGAAHEPELETPVFPGRERIQISAVGKCPTRDGVGRTGTGLTGSMDEAIRQSWGAEIANVQAIARARPTARDPIYLGIYSPKCESVVYRL